MSSISGFSPEFHVTSGTGSSSTGVITMYDSPGRHPPVCQFDKENGKLAVFSKSSKIGDGHWMWPEYQTGIQCAEFQGTKACFGYASGRVVVIDLVNW